MKLSVPESIIQSCPQPYGFRALLAVSTKQCSIAFAEKVLLSCSVCVGTRTNQEVYITAGYPTIAICTWGDGAFTDLEGDRASSDSLEVKTCWPIVLGYFGAFWIILAHF